MKVLIINTFFEGTSTGKIATGFYQKLIENGHECKLLYGAGAESKNNDFIKIATKFDIKLQWLNNQITGIHGNFSPFVMRRVFKIINEFRPDVVQLYNLHFYYINIFQLFDFLKENKIPTVYSMLDEYPYLGYCCYAYDCRQYIEGCKHCNYKRFRKEYPRNLLRNGALRTIELKKKAYADFEKLIFTAPEWVVLRAKESYLLKEKKISVVDEYVDTEKVFIPRECSMLKRELKIPENNKIILNVAPSNDLRKGISYYLKLAQRFEGERYSFIHVGYQGDKQKVPKNFIPISFVKDQMRLAEFYSLADVFVCTSIADTMPNVCLDALACGTPVLGFNVTGIPYVAEEPMGYFVEKGDIFSLEKLVRSASKKNADIVKTCREYALKRYSPETYYQKIMNLYNQLLI